MGAKINHSVLHIGTSTIFSQGFGSGSALEWKGGSGSALKSKFRSFRGSKWSRGGSWKWRLKMEAWRAFRPVVADSHHLDEEQDPDPH